MTATLALALLLAADPKDDGFTPLFNGKDLSGWQVAANKDKDKGGESLDKKTETPTKRYVVKDGVIVIDPKVKGDMVLLTDRKFEKDAHIKFEFKPGKGCNNDLYFRGLKFDIKPEAIKPCKLDEWNTLEIIGKGGEAEVKVNGESVQKLKIKGSSAFGIRAEGGPIEVKNIRVKE
jgi:hypothetical protein